MDDRKIGVRSGYVAITFRDQIYFARGRASAHLSDEVAHDPGIGLLAR